jgi:hypothetical protein
VSNITKVTTRVPKSSLDEVLFDPRWDFIGPAWIFETAQLSALNKAMEGVMVVK